EDNLDIKPHNSYHAFDYSKVKPLWEVGEIYSRYLKDNIWIGNIKVSKPMVKTLGILGILRQILERIFNSDWLENKLKQYQSQRILSDTRTLNSPKGKVFISDKELRFHPEKNLDTSTGSVLK
ncbi:MAG: hypothetical protein Q7K11_01265, partial [Candidatus Berkelbacteria bacterium]|nr:hypothetical protein [Candidatus Berkelbacteria bacterium]